MRKDSIAILGTSLFIASVLIGAAYYLNEVYPGRAEPHAASGLSTSADHTAVGNPASVQQGNFTWTNKPIECFDEEVGEFWTNAKDCQSADLSNRLSTAQSVKQDFHARSHPKQSRDNPNKSAIHSSGDGPSLRMVAQAAPDGLSVSCKFAVGRALEVERDLSAADDPAESIWRENYCKWIREVRHERCVISPEYFYYKSLCAG